MAYKDPKFLKSQAFADAIRERVGAGPNYTQDFQVGSGSPWGLPNAPAGNNQDFYAQQFANLLGETQRQRQAEMASQLRVQQPQQQAPTDPWEWANQGAGLNEGYPWDISPPILEAAPQQQPQQSSGSSHMALPFGINIPGG
jgi:hypothetical protein